MKIFRKLMGNYSILSTGLHSIHVRNTLAVFEDRKNLLGNDKTTTILSKVISTVRLHLRNQKTVPFIVEETI